MAQGDRQKNMKELIKQLAEVWGPSGYEHRVRATLHALVAPYVDASYVDGLGNLIVRVGNGGKKILFAAHMDQIGMMITYREPNGFLRFSPIGGVLRPTLLGQRAVFEDGTVGTIGVHDQWGTARTQLPDLDGFFIDVSDGQGTDFRHGQPAVIESRVISRGSRIVGGALDDRVGCAVLVKALQDLNKQTANTVYMAFTVQEEVGERGAAPATFGVQPDVAIAVDVTPTGDEPKNLKLPVKLGAGTAIKIQDQGLLVSPAVQAWMVATAEQHAIPYQREVLHMGRTDATQMQLVGKGIPTGAVSIPCRYVHTPSETVDEQDCYQTVALIKGLANAPIPDFVA